MNADSPDARARRTARRLLAGAGCASLTAYHSAPNETTYVAHALTDEGYVLVAVRPAAGSALCEDLAPEDELQHVRLDVTLDAADASVRVTAATAHLLGHLHWVPASMRETVLTTARTPTCHCAVTGEDPLLGVAELAAVEGGRLALIETDRVVVHDVSGVSAHAIEDVVALSSEPTVSWGSAELLVATEAVRNLGDLSLNALCDAVASGNVRGVLCSERPSEGICPGLVGRVLCVDADARSVTLMQLGRARTRTVVLLFPDAPLTPAALGPALEGLSLSALSLSLLG